MLSHFGTIGWADSSPSTALSSFSLALKAGVGAIGLEEPQAYSTHAFRRGGAQDVLAQDGLAHLLWAGGWSGDTRAALAYVSRDQIEQRLLGEILLAASDDES